MKVYTSKNTESIMIYDHANGCACWGEKFYYVNFEGIKELWELMGEF